jgi:folate-binding Fe-S cluster repair protein YgfZ
VPFTAEQHSPDTGVAVMAADKQVGTTGSAAGPRGLAMLRLDRYADALATGTPITAGGIALTPSKPLWARFDWPGGKASA